MVISPLIAREMKRALHQRWLYTSRAGAAVFVGLVTVLSLWSTPFQSAASAGRTLFFGAAIVLFGLAFLSGLFLTSFCLHEEKATRMLELLLISDVRASGVLASKFMTHSNGAFQILMGTTPVLALCLVLGGVSSEEFLRMVSLLFTTLCLSTVIGLYAATILRTGRSAALLTFLVLTALSLGMWTVESLLTPGLLPNSGEIFLFPGLIQAYAMVPDLTWRMNPSAFGAGLQTLWLLIVGCFLLAIVRLPQSALERSRHQAKHRSRQTGEHTAPQHLRSPRRRRNPGEWLARLRSGSPQFLLTTIALTVAAMAGGFAWLDWPAHPKRNLLLILIPLTTHTLLKLALAAKASRLTGDARHSGELEILLTTPTSTSRLNRGMWRGLVRPLQFPIAFVVLTDLAVLAIGERFRPAYDPSTLILWMAVWGLIITLAIDVWALSWIGLWEGITARTSLRAFKRTLGQVYGIPLAIFAATLGLSPFNWYASLTHRVSEPALGNILWWGIVSFVLMATFTFRAKRLLQEQFRQGASEPLSTRSGSFRNLWHPFPTAPEPPPYPPPAPIANAKVLRVNFR